MTPAEAEALGRRWREAGGGWREGMRDGDGYIVTAVGEDGLPDASGVAGTAPAQTMVTTWLDSWPDLRDPATRGAALEVVRERWGPAFQVSPVIRFTPDAVVIVRWMWYANDKNENRGDSTSEAEALVAALEAAPPPP